VLPGDVAQNLPGAIGLANTVESIERRGVTLVILRSEATKDLCLVEEDTVGAREDVGS
jgi:hypothetical protein